MELFIIKRNGKKESFSIEKIKSAIAKAFLSVGVFATQDVLGNNIKHLTGGSALHFLRECPSCKSKNLDYLTRIIGYMKRVSNFSQDRQQEAARRHYAEIS